jgi:signal transduction histidine kinase
MRSIRLALSVYFLLLLGLALGTVSILVYRNSREALAAKEKSTADLLGARNEARCNALGQQFDDALRSRASVLAGIIRMEWSGAVPSGLTAFGAVATPYTYLVLPSWLLERPEREARPLIRIRVAEDILAMQRQNPETDYFQIYDELGEVKQRSRAVGNAPFTLDPRLRIGLGLLEWAFDDIVGKRNVPLRRITLKAPVPLNLPIRRRGRWPPPPGQPSLRAVFIQVASETRERDKQLAAFRADLERDLMDLSRETAATLASLRRELAWIAGITFAATVVGTFWLIGVGLAPLRHLSQAVRHVSEKDFRLPLDERHLPRELRPIRNRIAQTLDLLRQAFAREKQSVADMSHELRTPVAALLTTLEVGLRKARSADEYESMLRECQAIGQQLSELVERLLALARLDAGADAVQAREVDVVGVAEECLQLVRPIAQNQGLELALHARGPLPIHTDPGKLREILTNLLHNAIEYNRPGGRIDLTVERANGQVQVAVRDTGIGIPAAARPQIFERFFRADDSRHAEGLHAGLGLAIVRAYTDLLGGKISFESQEGQGTTFRLDLPAAGS